MEHHSGIQSQGIVSVEEFEITHANKPFAIEDSYLDTEVVSSNHSECVRTMQERLIGEGYPMVDRSTVRVGKQIGKGGQGTVYEASVYSPYVEEATTMAVKKFNSKLGISQGQYPLKLWTEPRINILAPNGFFVDDDSSLCMLMPKYSGDLREAIDAGIGDSSHESGASGAPFEEGHAFLFIVQITLGMKGLHESGIYHRDLKASNILLAKSLYTCVIADFEGSENVVGTAFWRAPEVLLSLKTKIPLTKNQWQAADVYSFGMTCYEILTGEVPFRGHPLSDYDIVLDGGRPQLPDHIPQSLKDIIRSCWHHVPNSRPDFGEILEALMIHARGDPLLDCMPEIVENALTVLESTSGSPQSNLLRLKEIVQKRYDFNHEAKAGHLNYAFWGPKFVVAIEQFISEFGWNSYQTHPSLPFAKYIRRQTLFALISQAYDGFSANLVHDQLLKDMDQCRALEKAEMPLLAGNMYRVIMEGRNQSRFEDSDNDLTLKEKFKLLDAFVMVIKNVFGEDFALESIQDIVEKMDPNGTNTEIAEFHFQTKFMVHRFTFLNEYFIHFQLIVGSIVLYLMYNSSYCKYILFQIFEIMLSDYYEVFLGFFCPLIEFHGIRRLQASIPRYRNYFVLLSWIFSIFTFYLLFRSYGLLRYFSWLFVVDCIRICVDGFIVLLGEGHKYLYLMFRASRASFFFVDREKVKEE